MSLGEAKKITAEFKGTAYAPPPRTVADIEAMLDENRLTNWQRVEADRRLADSQPPAGASRRELAQFHRDRAKAAIFVGRFIQARQDLLKTLEILHQAGIRETRSGSSLNETEIHADLAHAEQFSGRLGQWRVHTAVRVRFAASRTNDQSPSPYAVAATAAAAATGWLAEAEAYIESADQRVSNIYNWGSDFAAIVRSQVPASTGRVLDYQGRHWEAEPLLRKAVQQVRQDRAGGKNPETRGGRYNLRDAWAIVEIEFLNWLSTNLIRQGRLAEAELTARDSLKVSVARWGRYSPYTARALNHLNWAVAAQNRLDDSRRLTEATLEILDKTGVPAAAWERARLGAHIAGIEMLGSNWQATRDILHDLRELLRKADPTAFRARFRGDPNYLLALIKTDDAPTARAILEPQSKRLGQLLSAQHYQTAEMGALLAMARAAVGETDAALAGFRAAVPILLRHSRAVSGDDIQQRFRRNHILESYLDLLADRNLAAEAFPIADVLKGSTVQAAVAASAAQVAARDPQLADLVRREQDA